MYILVVGNPITGFEYIGPFDNTSNATKHGEGIYPGIEWWVVALTSIHIENKCSCGHLWSQHNQNVHGIWVCTQCNCRNMNRPSENP